MAPELLNAPSDLEEIDLAGEPVRTPGRVGSSPPSRRYQGPQSAGAPVNNLRTVRRLNE